MLAGLSPYSSQTASLGGSWTKGIRLCNWKKKRKEVKHQAYIDFTLLFYCHLLVLLALNLFEKMVGFGWPRQTLKIPKPTRR